MRNHTLYTILKHYLRGDELPLEVVNGVDATEWEELYKISIQQGVVAIVYGMIAPLVNHVSLPRKVKLQWALHSENVERRTRWQIGVANDLANIYKSNNINTVVLKGFGVGVYYPTLYQRECGDFDCYLFDDFKKGVDVAIEHGAKEEHADYKHTQLVYKGLSVEVHKYFTSFRGERAKHTFEKTLNNLMRNQSCKPISTDSNILQPNPTFSAVFLLYHTLFHFLFESVKLRHILDWGLMVKAEQNMIDWNLFKNICQENKMLKFAEAITAICNDYLGFDLNVQINAASDYRDKVLCDIMLHSDGVSNKKGWERRVQLLKNTYKSRWKYQLVDTTYTTDLARRVFYFIFSNDKLKTL